MHGIIPLLDSPMVLLQAIVEIFAGSMEHLIAQRFAYRSWIGGMSVCCHPFGCMAGLFGLPEKSEKEIIIFIASYPCNVFLAVSNEAFFLQHSQAS